MSAAQLDISKAKMERVEDKRKYRAGGVLNKWSVKWTCRILSASVVLPRKQQCNSIHTADAEFTGSSSLKTNYNQWIKMTRLYFKFFFEIYFFVALLRTHTEILAN